MKPYPKIEGYVRKLRKRLIAAAVFLFGWLAATVLLGTVMSGYQHLLQSECSATQKIIWKAMVAHVESGGQVPVNQSQLEQLEYKSIGGKQRFVISREVRLLRGRYNLKYHPEAWNKPCRILIEDSIPGAIVVTFGDGARAVFSEWVPVEGERISGRTRGIVSVLGLLLVFAPAACMIVALIGAVALKRKQADRNSVP